jgi:hypothetical protein
VAENWRQIMVAKNKGQPASHKRIERSRVEWAVAPDHRNSVKDRRKKEPIMAKKQSTNQKSNRALNRTTGQTGAAKKPISRKKTTDAPFNEQDPKRRLGNFGGAGDHPRQGRRTSGIVG